MLGQEINSECPSQFSVNLYEYWRIIVILAEKIKWYPLRLELRDLKKKKMLELLLELCVSSLRRGHANLLCIVPIISGVTYQHHPLPDQEQIFLLSVKDTSNTQLTHTQFTHNVIRNKCKHPHPLPDKYKSNQMKMGRIDVCFWEVNLVLWIVKLIKTIHILNKYLELSLINSCL